MDIGMLWRDEDESRTLEQKIARAAEYYRNKYGAQPTVCFVHPSLLLPDMDALRVAGLRVLGTRTVQPNHFWLGVNAVPVAAQTAPPESRESVTV